MLGAVAYTYNPSTWELEAEDQSSRQAMATGDSVSKHKTKQSDTIKQTNKIPPK